MSLAPAHIQQDLTGTASKCLALCPLNANFLETEYNQFFLDNDYVLALTSCGHENRNICYNYSY